MKLSNTSRARAPLSDLVWSFLGMFIGVAALGLIAMDVRNWPFVGTWHQQGLNLLLGSFGTICVLIFGRPESEALRMWNVLAGHLISITIVVGLLHLLGPGLVPRALAMGLMLAAQMATDSVHPPGGALVLMAVDSPAIQHMDWWFLLYPSLTYTLGVLLPVGAGTNWLKRNVKFDFPWAEASSRPQAPPSSPGMRPKTA